MPDSRDYHGSLVAFEGPADTISTQLRLLPTSPQILILPAIQTYIRTPEDDEKFDARSCIRRIHDAAAARTEAARAFLRESSPSNKRLVFANGGSPGAQALCIREIAEHETDGDLSLAEANFNDLIREGLVGLEKVEEKRFSISAASLLFSSYDDLEDPISRAMRAAEALDRLAESFQPLEADETPTRPRPRSMSLPLYSFDDKFGDAVPFYVFGAPAADEARGFGDDMDLDLRKSGNPTVEVCDCDEDLMEESLAPSPICLSRVPSCVGETYRPRSALPTASSDHRAAPFDILGARTGDHVVHGRASLVDIRQTVKRRGSNRSRSLDRASLATRPSLRLRIPRAAHDHDALEILRGRPQSCITNGGFSSVRSSVVAGQRLGFRSNRSTLQWYPAPLKKLAPARTSYVDRGTDAEDLSKLGVPFQPVLPFVEDLIIHVKDGDSDRLVESLILALKESLHPSAPSSTSSEPDDCPDVPRTPSSQHLEPEHAGILMPMATHTPEDGDYDPYSYDQPKWSEKRPLAMNPVVPQQSPPTPAQTPPPSMSESDDKFYDFDITGCQSAVVVQNSLRSVLNRYFPPNVQGFCQFRFSLLPELDCLWKPIFRRAEPNSPQQDRTMDLILAVGSQAGVKKGFVTSVVGQLESLGTKPSGVHRSGRLDFRYLIANAMQAFTAQPLSHQTQDNPFTNSYLLATLIIPSLETYLAAHSDVRFLLLEYPPEHLATVLALQKLVGVDVMKVAQIVDSQANSPLPFTHIKGTPVNGFSSDSASTPSLPSSPSTSSQRQLSQSSSSPQNLTMSTANFLLTASATESEITTFITTVWKLLMDISSYYIPDDKPARQSAKAPSGRGKSSVNGNFSPFSRLPTGLHSPPLSPPTSTGRFSGRPESPGASTLESLRTESVKSPRANRPRVARGRARDESTDSESADESDMDVEERRLMPMFRKTGPARKGNTRKALKFLGLA